MIKRYCDICDKPVDTNPSRRKSLVEVEQILEAGNINDICPDCLKAAEDINWNISLRQTIRAHGAAIRQIVKEVYDSGEIDTAQT